MKKLFLLSVLVLTACTGQMCSVPPQMVCLGIGDVSGLPTGNATGSSLTGSYRILTGFMRTCDRCPGNSAPASHCSDFTIDPSVLAPIVQQDGLLTWQTSEGGPTFTGGVDADGRFWMGAITTMHNSEGESTGQVLVLMEGTFQSNRFFCEITAHTTRNDDQGGIWDLQSVAECVFERVE